MSGLYPALLFDARESSRDNSLESVIEFSGMPGRGKRYFFFIATTIIF